MNIEAGLASKDIMTLKEMDNQLADYIKNIRSEQIRFRGFIQEVTETAWKQGEVKMAFLKEMIEHNEQFSKEIQRLENVRLEITDTIRSLKYIAQSAIY